MLDRGLLLRHPIERRLCEEVHLNLAYRWFCRLGLEDPGAGSLDVLQESAWPLPRQRHPAIRVRAGPGALRAGGAGEWRRVRDRCELGEGRCQPPARCARRRGRLVEPASISRPVREYLAALDQAEVEKNTPKNISLTDPAAQWSAAWGPAFYAYSTNYLVDTAAGIVVDVEATPAHKIDEINATKTMIDRVEKRFDLKPERLIGDTNYGTAEILGWMVDEKAIEPHVPVWDKTATQRRHAVQQRLSVERTGRRIPLSARTRVRSEWRAFKNPRTHVTKADTIIYRSSQSDCATCPMKARCCPNTPVRKIVRSIHEAAATSRANPKLLHTSAHATNARRSRCCSRTSSESSSWIACAYEASAVPATSSAGCYGSKSTATGEVVGPEGPLAPGISAPA